MRYLPVAILFVALAGPLPVRADDSANGESSGFPLQGAWRCVAAKYGSTRDFQDVPASTKMIKLVTGTHFTWVRVNSDTMEISSAGGGPYTADGDSYTETVEYGLAMGNLIGEEQKFTWEADGDKWSHSGTLSIGLKIAEVWERMKPSVDPASAESATERNSPATPLLGAWKLVAGKYGDAAEFEDASPEETMIKLVTDTHFIWVRFDSKTKEVSHAAGGRCSVSDDKYTEHIEYGIGPVMQLKGTKQPFTWKLEGDRWHHSGTLSNGTRLEEIFERVKNASFKE